MAQNVCVFCSSSSAVAPLFFEAATGLGRLIAQGGHTLVFGGVDAGLMGAVARAAKGAGGRVVGVLPEAFRAKGCAFADADELIWAGDMRQRKAVMDQRSDAFLALPGGLGTLEELLEALTLKQLGYHHKPVVMINTDGFYAPLLGAFEQLYAARFAKASSRGLYHVADDAAAALAHLAAYRPAAVEAKWFDRR